MRVSTEALRNPLSLQLPHRCDTPHNPNGTLSSMKKLASLLVRAVAILCSLTYAVSCRAAAPNTLSMPAITLGNSVVPLEQGWKFCPGDSPWVNGVPLWAQPSYDDSHWSAMDLIPRIGSVDLVFGTPGFVAGWTSRGYPRLNGYAWYRLRVRVANPAQPLWLKMPNNFDDALQLYADGRYAGEFGGFSGKHVTVYSTQPVSFPLPAPEPDGAITLALRFYMNRATALYNPDAGGLHGPPALGLASAVHWMQASEKEAILRTQFGTFFVGLFDLLTAPLVLWAWLYNRRTRIWLWLFLALVWQASLAGNAVALVTAAWSLGIAQAVAVIVLPFWVIFWWHWFGLEEKRWIPRAAWLLAGIATMAGLALDLPNFGSSFVPQAALPWCHGVAAWFAAAISLLELVILIEGIRRDRLEALLPSVPILLGLVNAFWSYFLVGFHIPNEFFPFGLGISVSNFIDSLTLAIIVALSLRRFMKMQVRESAEREAIHRDLEQAQQLQQNVLVSTAVQSPAFVVETEYRPAQTVGGDFFQTLTRSDGALLAVIGDVSGKGVSASMLVAVLVGAIRNQADYNFDPQAMLAMLNRRMMGPSGGHFATCLAAEIAFDGTARMANAGHLPPYFNGAELTLEGSLPLGFSEEVEYPVRTMKLKPGDRLTFMTDGVPEAKNAANEMFGFERARAVSGEPAAAIAQQAQIFGQEDDITVVSVAFAAPGH